MVLPLEEGNRDDGWAVERRLKGGGPATESSENKELGLEDMRSHQRILSIMWQGHFWDGNFAALETDYKHRSWRQGKEL